MAEMPKAMKRIKQHSSITCAETKLFWVLWVLNTYSNSQRKDRVWVCCVRWWRLAVIEWRWALNPTNSSSCNMNGTLESLIFTCSSSGYLSAVNAVKSSVQNHLKILAGALNFFLHWTEFVCFGDTGGRWLFHYSRIYVFRLVFAVFMTRTTWIICRNRIDVHTLNTHRQTILSWFQFSVKQKGKPRWPLLSSQSCILRLKEWIHKVHREWTWRSVKRKECRSTNQLTPLEPWMYVCPFLLRRYHASSSNRPTGWICH